jgi:hypothetical protein
MRAREFILVEAALGATELFNPKYDRPATLMKMIADGTPLTLLSGQPFVADNSPESMALYQADLDAKRAPKLINKENPSAKVSTTQLLKTVDFGGHGVPTGTDATAVVNKTTLALKPVNIGIEDKLYNIDTLLSAIQTNETLSQTDHGKTVIVMAEQLAAGTIPTYPEEYEKSKVAAIQDDAGEYLGVLGLLHQTALNFPTMREFQEHLGITDISGLTIEFPSKMNEPLGDSFAVKGSIQNPETGNRILISSKGKTGAAPSITGLKIPADIEANETFALEVEFIKLIQTTKPADYQPLKALNWLKQNTPDKLPSWVAKHLPLTDEQMDEIMKWKDNKKYQISNAAEYAQDVPGWLGNLLGEIPPNARVAPHASPGGWLLYKMTRAVMEAVNDNKALPNFESIAREILQRNFIQINATAKKGQMTFTVMWPNRQMGTGTITLETKNTASITGSSMGFRVK